MKYSIEGFNQEYAMTLKKDVEVKGKIITRRIDCTDLVILRWFVDFYPSMKKQEIDGADYVWLSHKKLAEDLPLIDINKRAFAERLQKLVDFEILIYKLSREGGTFSLYGFGRNYEKLISVNAAGGMSVDPHKGCGSTYIGYAVQPANKDISIKDTSIKDNNIYVEFPAKDSEIDEGKDNEFTTEHILDVLCKEYQTRRNNKAESRKSVIELLKGKKTYKGLKYRVQLNHVQLYFAVRQYMLDCKNAEFEPSKILLLSTFLNGRVLDYAELTRHAYEEYMQREYGENWQNVKFTYRE